MINLNDGKIIHNKNLLINPNFGVIQGTASGTLANSTALPTQSLGYLGETNWCIAASGGTPAYAFSSANESVTFTGAASTTAIYLLQRLESKDLTTLANKLATITFSFETSNSLLTDVNWSILRPTTTADIHGTIGAPTQTSIASGTVTVNSTLTRYSVTVTLPSQAALGAEIRLSVGAQTSGTWVVSRLQLEEGSVATNFNCGDYSHELLRCRRYAQIIEAGLQSPAIGSLYYEIPLVPMLATPVASIVSTGVSVNSSLGINSAPNNFTFAFQITVITANGSWLNRQYLLLAHIP